MSRAGFGNVIKIGILFDEVFWDNSQYYFAVASGGSGYTGMQQSEKYSYFLNVNACLQRPVLMTFVFGESAQQVESTVIDGMMLLPYKLHMNLFERYGAVPGHSKTTCVGSLTVSPVWRCVVKFNNFQKTNYSRHLVKLSKNWCVIKFSN